MTPTTNAAITNRPRVVWYQRSREVRHFAHFAASAAIGEWQVRHVALVSIAGAG